MDLSPDDLKNLQVSKLCEIARDGDTPPAIMMALINHTEMVRIALAENTNLSENVKAMLLNDSCLYVRSSLARYQTLTASHLHLLLIDHADVRSSLASNESLNLETFQQLASDSTQAIRVRVAENPNAPIAVLDALSKGLYWERAAVAANHNTSRSTLSVLATDPDVPVRMAVAKNPHTPTETLILQAQDQSQKVLMALIERESLSTEVIDALIVNADDDVREAIANNRYLNAHHTEILSHDESAEVRVTLASNPLLSTKVFKTLAQDTFSWVRYGLLENAVLPPSTLLSLLCADPVQGVRSRAIELARRKPLDYWLSENISLSQNWVLDNQNVQTGDILLRNDMHSAYQAIQAAELERKICTHAVPPHQTPPAECINQRHDGFRSKRRFL
ncbi:MULTISPECIES: hypothetical protein [Aeromonas]|uniref:DUF2336 domain-containing protein n=1 Tax=Aeromonas veronii TaxID=654 RepID=A0A4S5CDG8_AERVE|nr:MULTISPECIES: hypothetical protein [Aeromonas]THJ43630.1 hypothetical protein E8Q35_15090 [Aeromonas veronii]